RRAGWAACRASLTPFSTRTGRPPAGGRTAALPTGAKRARPRLLARARRGRPGPASTSIFWHNREIRSPLGRRSRESFPGSFFVSVQAQEHAGDGQVEKES